MSHHHLHPSPSPAAPSAHHPEEHNLSLTPFQQEQEAHHPPRHLHTHFIAEKRLLIPGPPSPPLPAAPFLPRPRSCQQIVLSDHPQPAAPASAPSSPHHDTSGVHVPGGASVERQRCSSPREDDVGSSVLPQKADSAGRGASGERRCSSPHEDDVGSIPLPQKVDSAGSGSEDDYLTGSSDSSFPERTCSPAASRHRIAKTPAQKPRSAQNVHPLQHRSKAHGSIPHTELQRGEQESAPAANMEPATKMVQKSQVLHPLACLEGSLAHRMTHKLWVEEERLLQSRTRDQEAFCRSTERDIYLVLGLNFLFQAFTVAGAAQASALNCNSSWVPLIMSLIVSVATFLATLQKLEARERLMSQLRAYRADTRLIVQYIDRLRLMGDMFDLMDLPQLTSAPLSKARSSCFPRKLVCGFTVFVLLILSLFSVIAFVSFRAILCHH